MSSPALEVPIESSAARAEATTLDLASHLRPVRFGLLLSVGAILFGFGIGGAFGGFEDGIKAHLKQVAEVNASRYGGDAAKQESTVTKSFTYLKRAHLHGGAIGAASVGVILALAMLRRRAGLRAAAAAALGAGGLGYSIYWLVAGLRAPALGSTGAAKESLAWLALPTAGLLLGGLALSLGLLAAELYARPRT
jgi:hypothetical protein